MKLLGELDRIIDKFIATIDKSRGSLIPILKYGGLLAMLYLGYRIWKYYGPKLKSASVNEEEDENES